MERAERKCPAHGYNWICFPNRTRCMNWFVNQFRVLLSAMAETLIEAIRRLALGKTNVENACCGTIRLKLLKIGADIFRNTRRVRMLLSKQNGYA